MIVCSNLFIMQRLAVFCNGCAIPLVDNTLTNDYKYTKHIILMLFQNEFANHRTAVP